MTSMKCVYCENPLECDSCRLVYEPPGSAHYAALSRPEVALSCPACGATLVCHWCKTPYDGEGDDEAAED
jgi:hypothetical protein